MAAAAALQRQISRWIKRRQGEDTNPFSVTRRRLYILPTAAGVIFGAMVLAMLIGSLNYGANLGFALTFLLAGIGLISMHHAHNNLLGIVTRFNAAQPVFAGEHAEFHLELSNPGADARYACQLTHDEGQSATIDIPPQAVANLSLRVPAPVRGRLKITRFKLESRHPAGLLRAWTVAHLELVCTVYPKPAAPGVPLPESVADGTTNAGEGQGEADFAGLRDYHPGDPTRRIAWKSYARTRDLVVKEFAGAGAAPCMLRLTDAPGSSLEAQISQLARWCLDAHESGLAFGVELPQRTVPLGTGRRQLHRCLEALALCPGGTLE